MTLFGIIWLFIMAYCFKKKNNTYMIFATLLFMTFQCSNVLYLGSGKGVGPQVLTSICFIIKYLISTNFKLTRIKKNKSFFASLSLTILMLVIILSGVINNSFAGKVLVSIQLAIYVVAFFFMMRATRKMDRELLYKIARSVIVFVVVVGFVQWFVTMFFPSGRIILKYIFYNDNDANNIFFNYHDVAHSKRIYSTFMEPSFLAVFSVGAFYYLLCFWGRIRKNIYLLLMLMLIIVVSYSSTAYGAFAITGVIFIISSKEIKPSWKIVIVSIAAVLLLAFFTVFYNVLDTVIFSKASTGSGITRARWNREAYSAFLSSPIIGVGYKAARGSSIILSLMGELGILGLVTFLQFNIFSVWRAFVGGEVRKKYSIGYYGALYATISSLICLIIACPDLDLCSYWFWLYILSCYNGMELVEYKTKKIIKIASTA